MKIYHFSDTHGHHEQLRIPEGIELAIFSGDESNSRDPYINESEIREFLEWYESLNIRHKIFTPGNHSTAIEKKLVHKSEIERMGIRYLENEETTVEGIRIWGSPYSPVFGNWAFMKARHKMFKLWDHIPEDVDIVVTHTPPKGTLDLSYDFNGKLEFCGCSNLFKNIMRVRPQLHLFGHIHNCQDIRNAGSTQLAGLDTIFSNASVVTDGRFGKVSSHGNVFTL